ncbi:hypothetical protein ACFW6F_33025 [Streptomyces sp. NPDC058746]|uniref:hypothetical protein n=1 Tax=Streptomyces sp. NPDC058746 TaxID=3346622 RepID=UPI0036AB9526
MPTDTLSAGMIATLTYTYSSIDYARSTAQRRLVLEAHRRRRLSGIATLIGLHTNQRGSYSRSRDGGSQSWSEQREQILEAADVRAMPKGSALLLSTGMPIAQIRLRPWYLEASMKHLGPEKDYEELAITKRAIAAHEARKAARSGR